ncbi:MAG: hypothetical protein M3081_16710 [Gemmatimonadota bacterium]|nr:hypothetical protein [Gemmatimonadota bacterium]
MRSAILTRTRAALGTLLFFSIIRAGALLAQSASGDARAKPAYRARTPVMPDSSEQATPQAPPVLPALDSVRVIAVHLVSDSPKSGPVRAGMGDIIVLEVKGLRDLINRAKCMSDDERHVGACTPTRLVLFLDGREIKDLAPESGAPQAGRRDGTVQFHLSRSPLSDEAWADLLGSPSIRGEEFWFRPTRVSVGLENGFALDSDIPPADFQLIRIRQMRFWLASIGLLAIMIFFVMHSRNTNLLRDSGQPAAAPPIDPALPLRARLKMKRKMLKPYSLSRVQMAYWFFLVVASFMFIWLVTGSSDTITGSVLALIGISAGTFLGATAIDSSKRDEDNADISGESTNGFLNDILHDAHGPTFHRFQMVVWTLVLGFLFIVSVWGRLSMPEFGGTMLGLLGVSSGTYLGFKLPEKTP